MGEWDGLLRSKSNTYFPCEGHYTNIPFNELPRGNEVLINEYGLVRSGGNLMALLTTWVNEFPRWLETQGYDPNEPFYYGANHDRVVEFWQYSINKNKDYEVLWPIGLRGAGDEDYKEPGVKDLDSLVRDAVLKQAKMIDSTPGLMSRDKIFTAWSGDYGILDNGMVPSKAAYALSDGMLKGTYWCDVVPLISKEARIKNPDANWGAYFHNQVRTSRIRRSSRDRYPGIAKINQEFNMLLANDMNYVWEINNGCYKGRQYANEYIATFGRDPKYWKDPMRVDEFIYRVMKRDFGETYVDEIVRIFKQMDTRNLINYGTYRRGVYGIGVSEPIFYPDPYTIINFGDEFNKAIEKFEKDLKDAWVIYHKLESQQRDGFWKTIIWPLRLHLSALKQHYYGYKATLAWKQERRSARVFLSLMEKAANDVSENALDYQTIADGFWYGYSKDSPREFQLVDLWGHNSNNIAKWYHERSTRYGTYSLRVLHENLHKMVDEMKFNKEAMLDVTVESEMKSVSENHFNTLPIFSIFNKEKRFFDIGNKGNPSYEWTAEVSKSWINLSQYRGKVNASDERIWVSINWDNVPMSNKIIDETIIIDAGKAGKKTIKLRINNPRTLRPDNIEGHIEVDGFLCVEAENYWKKLDRGDGSWKKTRISFQDDGCSMSAYPLNLMIDYPKNSPELIYKLNFQNPGKYYLNFCLFDRTLYKNFYYSIDEEQPMLVKSSYPEMERDEHVRSIPIKIKSPGIHYLHIYMSEPGVVIDQIIFSKEKVDIGNFRLQEPIKDAHYKYRAAVAPENFNKL